MTDRFLNRRLKAAYDDAKARRRPVRPREARPPHALVAVMLEFLRRWWLTKTHTCQTPDPRTFAPVEGRAWVCPECTSRWVYEARDVEYEVQPGVWDRWPETATESVVAWYKVAS